MREACCRRGSYSWRASGRRDPRGGYFPAAPLPLRSLSGHPMLLLPLLPFVWAPALARLWEDDRCNQTEWQKPSGGEGVSDEKGHPLNVTVNNWGYSNALFLTWEYFLGGAQGFSLALYDLDTNTLLQNGSTALNTTSFSFQGLLPGTQYIIEITALLACAHNSSTRITGQTVPLPVRDVTLSHESPSVLLASWSEPPGGKDGYQLVLYHIDSQAPVKNATIAGGTTTFRFEKLLPGSEYALRITTWAGYYKASTSARDWTAPAAPKTLTFQNNNSSSSLIASWTNSEGAEWLYFTLQNLHTPADSRTVSLRRGLTNYTFQHLEPGTPYHLDVKAVSGPYLVKGPNITAYTYPLKPANVNLINYDSSSTLKASWNSAAGEREYYLVILQKGDSSIIVRNISAGGNSTYVIFQDLAPGSHYTAWVTAVAGPHKATAKSISAWTYPTAPSSGNLLNQGSAYTLQAHWQEAAGTGYVTTLYTMEPLIVSQNSSLPKQSSSQLYEGLRPGTRYALEICTVAGPHTSLPLHLSNWTHPLPPDHLKLNNDGHRMRSLHASWQNSSKSGGFYVGALLETKSQLVIKNVTLAEANITFEMLIPGRQYTLKLARVAGPFQSHVQIVSDWTYPLVPSGVMLASSRWSSSLVASWDRPLGDRDQFFLRFYSLEQPLQRNITIGPSMLNFTFEGLQPGSQYLLEVTAMAGPYRASAQVVSAWTYPLSLANVSVKCSQNPQQLIVSWMESGRGRGYWVQLYSEESLSIIQNVSVPHGTTQVTLDNLVPGTRYRVEIVSRAGPHYVSSQTAIGYTVPLLPLSLKVISHSSSVLSVQWKAPAGQRDGYMVSVSKEGSTDTRSHMFVEKTSTNITIVGLTPGTCYLIAVWSLAGPYSSASRNSSACTAPAAPMNLTLKNMDNSSVLYTAWVEPPGGRDHYRMILYSLDPPGMKRVRVIGPGVQNFLWTGLPAGSHFAVQVISVKGHSEASSTIAAEWTSPLPAASVQIWNEGHPNRLHAAWAPASGRLDGYELNLYHTGSSTLATQAYLGSDATNFTFSDLTPGINYLLEILSKAGPYRISAGNFSAWTSPLPPRTVLLSNKGHTDKLSATWEPPAGDQSGYVLTLYNAALGTVVAKVSVEKDITNFTFGSLIPGSKYLLEVASIAGPYRISTGNISDWTYPFVPRKLSVKAEKGNPALSVTWAKPVSKPERCQLQLWHSENSTMLQHHTLTQWQVQHIFQGLVPGRNYSVSLTCVAGPYKNSSETIVVPIEPSHVKDLQCLPDTTSMFLNWTIIENDIKSYELTVNTFPKRVLQQSLLPLVVSQTNVTLIELTTNTSYQIQVNAVGMNGIKGPAVIIVCNTSVEVLPPPVRIDLPQFDASSRVIISPDMFSEENGLIEYYGIVVTTNESLLRPTQEIISRTWYDHYYGQEDSYLAVLLPNPFHLNESTSPKAWPVSVGAEECSHSRVTCNGKLKTNTQYRFSIAAFTRYSQQTPKVSFTVFSAAAASADSETLSAPVVAGIIMGFLVTATAISGWVYWKHLRTRRVEKGNIPQEMAIYSLRNTHRPIPLQSFRQYYETRTANSNNGFFQDFEELKEVGKEQPKTEAEVPANTIKNRYPHVLPYDYSRVKLTLLDGQPHSDYINANFVPGYNSPQEFIATQGPLKKTLDDFWRLVWEQNICTIVMLTVGMENGRVLCEYYWPTDTSPVSSGEISIHLLAQNFADEWTTREFKLQHKGLNMERRVSHLHYTAWPNHGVPESTISMIAFIELVRAHMQSVNECGPILVHGSAGVGRTGTFIALDRLLQQLKHENLVDIFGTIYSLRMNRHRMIETLGQYIFLHSCILEKISEDPIVGLSEISHPVSLKSFVQHHANNCSQSNAGFLKEYEQMLLEVAKEEINSAIPPSVNQQINLSSSKIPYDRAKVKFLPLDRDPFSDLAHVWFIPGCNSAKDYIAIEGPDKLALEEFWGLVWERGVHTIITLLPGQTNSPAPDKSCWPSEGEPICTEMLTIQQGPEKIISGWPCVQLRLKYEKKAKERLIQQFRFPLGEGEELPDPEILVGFLTVVRQLVPYRKRTNPLVLHCSSGGVGQMGILIALDTLLQQLKGEKNVDVYGVVLRLVRSCCLMTPSLDKYIYLYECIRDVITQKHV
ncbi:receptor-type tyrosine-protein phosphatase V-like [Python bivittatus]|uniref:Receptor-type tyrosine-protein phosphatase V n=1 Tax=Python bivittatus TaxID=176946 RepID=A0A9F2QXQ8_PYTBI|nr:receptor-type tyrosine-protein phosphatase V-like [Python bivittatus]